jgi:hypothetical protein
MPSAEIIHVKFGVRSKIERYRLKARQCRARAALLTNPLERGHQQNFAAMWDELADAAAFEEEFRSYLRAGSRTPARSSRGSTSSRKNGSSSR